MFVSRCVLSILYETDVRLHIRDLQEGQRTVSSISDSRDVMNANSAGP